MSASTSAATQEFLLRVPKNAKKRYNVMRFHKALNIDVTKWNQVRMERENNMKDFKGDEEMPKFGAGSEFGRQQREEARRKKYGIIMKKYNPDDQPWLLRTGGKAGKKYRGIREGGIAENASYYVFVKAQDGAFEAYPVDEWYNFTPVQHYKTLNAEEAEEEFGKRDKIMNYFSIMLRKRMKNEDDLESKEEGEDKEKKKKKKPSKYGTGNSDFKISDMDEWINSSDAESEDDEVEEAEAKKEKKPDPKNKNKNKKKKKKPKGSDDDEPLEDSDDGDDEGREVDYMSDESSSEEEFPGEKLKNDMKGVEDEDAIRKMEESGSEEENEEEKKENEETKEDAATPAKPSKDKKDAKKAASSSESSSDTSDSDDFDNDSNFVSAMFMQKSKKNKGEGGSMNSRSNTPTHADSRKESKLEKGQKRSHASASAADPSTPSPPGKKAKLQAPSSQPHSSTPHSRSSSDNEGISEEAVRRYLMRKPMTTTELLHKFRNKKTGLSREHMVNTIAQILKRLNLDKKMIKDKMYLSIKPT